VKTARRFELAPLVERSRSGNGAHVWFFFSEPVAAAAARKMGCHLITETMAERHELGMDSYDRLFPSQDTMPRGGFGNLIALPLQDGPRRDGNSIFRTRLSGRSNRWRLRDNLRGTSVWSRFSADFTTTIGALPDARDRISSQHGGEYIERQLTLDARG
jgi:hypothetical protein